MSIRAYCPWCKKDVQLGKKTSSWKKRWCSNPWEILCLPLGCLVAIFESEDLFPGYDWHCTECHRRLSFKGAKSKGMQLFIPIGEETMKVGCPRVRNLLYTRWGNNTQMRASLAKQSADLLGGMILKLKGAPDGALPHMGVPDANNEGEGNNNRSLRSKIYAIWRAHFNMLPQGLDSTEIEARMEDAYLIARNGPYVFYASSLEWPEAKNQWLRYLAAFLIKEFGMGSRMMEQFNRLRDERNTKFAGKNESEKLQETMTFAVMKVMGTN
ncbi:uncharacterized protein K444DRAFT_607036 [Hyaloscypha bicolor E]|uniref:Uncharacterized protein n=1 Tax=Hyaloscypha bicolor E TaxID=1095630 RepID=A0A2J6TUT1_9HELO|nr:uncharacterized protein K444DRAFT_607036 [Hyaloscypha bicolor E]PMD66718.1 hypothetical protein K444DRAFT_607036 [Hyaloscypha bicolor E]